MRGRRVVGIVAVAVGVMGSVGCGGGSKTYGSVTGIVLDARTHRPIAGALVDAGEGRATTNATGTFELRDVSKVATITVRANNFRSLRRGAAPQLGEVTLAPIPVTGQLLSDLGLKGVKGVVIAPEQQLATAANGTFTVFGVGPGDSVTATGSGYGEGAGTVSSRRTVLITLPAMPPTAKAFDLPAIEKFWRDLSDSYASGGPSGARSFIAFTDAHNYPGILRESVAANCKIDPASYPPGYRVTATLDSASVRYLDDWRITFGPLKGQVPEGRIYSMRVTETVVGEARTRTTSYGLTIRDGRVYEFFGCS